MKILYGHGFTPADYINCKEVIYLNVVRAMKSLIEGAKEQGYVLGVEAQGQVDVIMSLRLFDEGFTPAVVHAIQVLWADPMIKQSFLHRSRHLVHEQVSDLFNKITEISNPNYVATDEDILRVRTSTTGVIETYFELQENHRFRVIDVGGQRSERRKWMQCFPDVNVVIFVAAINEIDMFLYEDSNRNRIIESLQLFEDTINNEYFCDTPIILFLNKEDLLREKLENGLDPTTLFPEYTGGNNFDLLTSFLKSEYLRRNHNDKREIFVRFTNALDTRYMQLVFDVVTKIILEAKLETFGFV